MLRARIERVRSAVQSSTLDSQATERVEIEAASHIVPLNLDKENFAATLTRLRAKYSDGWIEIRYRYPHRHDIVVPGFVKATLVKNPQSGDSLVPALAGFVSGVNLGTLTEWNSSSPNIHYARTEEEMRLIAAGQITPMGMLGLLQKAGARCEDGRVSLSSSSDHLTPVFGLISAVGIRSDQGERWLSAQGLDEQTAVGELPHSLHASSTAAIGPRLGAYSGLRMIGGAQHGDLVIYHPDQLSSGAALYEVIRPEEVRVLTPETLATAAALSIQVGVEVALVPAIGPTKVDTVVDATLTGVADNEPLRAIRQRVLS